MKFLLKEELIDGNKFYVYEKDRYKVVFSDGCGEIGYKKDTEEGKKNIHRLKELFDIEDIVYLNQIHSDKIWIDPECDIDGDGLITENSRKGIAVFGADCVPVIALDRNTGVLGACHSGWRGTIKEISSNLIESMIHKSGAVPEDIEVFIGPHGRECCYEVGYDLIEKFNQKELFKGRVNKERMLNLQEGIKITLVDSGIDENNITFLNKCTICQEEFHSYRRDGEHSGRNIAFVFKK